MTPNPETAALLKLLERGERQVAEGRVHEAAEVIAELRRKLKERDGQIESRRAKN